MGVGGGVTSDIELVLGVGPESPHVEWVPPLRGSENRALVRNSEPTVGTKSGARREPITALLRTRCLMCSSSRSLGTVCNIRTSIG